MFKQPLEMGCESMVRIKVIKASRLAMVLAVIVAVIVAAVLLTRILLDQDSAPTLSQGYAASAPPAGGAAPPAVAKAPQPTAQLAEAATQEAVAAFSVLPNEDAQYEDGHWIIDVNLASPADEQATSEPGDAPGSEARHEDEATDPEAPPMTIDVIPAETDVPDPNQSTPAPRKGKPSVLIYHTHTHEAYAQRTGDEYVETGKWRTADETHSIVRVGEALALRLRDMGVKVTHDITDFEPPKLGTAYVRSLTMLEKYGKALDQFDLVIDMHRDAYGESMNGMPSTAQVDGKAAARLMLLIGNGKGQGDATFDIKPDYQKNLALAQQLTDALNTAAPGLCRPVMVKTGRYNQHVSTKALLIEVGHNKNTLEEAEAAMPALSAAMVQLMGV